MLIYLDCVSSAPPGYGSDSGQTGPVRVAMSLEDDDFKIVKTLLMLVKPEPSWRIDASWMQKYGVPDIGMVEGVSTHFAISAILKWMPDNSTGNAPFVGHLVKFHTRQLVKLLGVANMQESTSDLCTMNASTNLLMIPTKNRNTFKSPTLKEAFCRFHPGVEWPDDSPTWMSTALRTLSMVRAVHHSVIGRPGPAELISAAPGETP